ncbi:MAG: hypothetical protein KAT70_08715 [Thermoplasmata archaeon]|nr:hypothetical protein [Thermoplasmata archaeon]
MTDNNRNRKPRKGKASRTDARGFESGAGYIAHALLTSGWNLAEMDERTNIIVLR